jgi:hypothetical protein
MGVLFAMPKSRAGDQRRELAGCVEEHDCLADGVWRGDANLEASATLTGNAASTRVRQPLNAAHASTAAVQPRESATPLSGPQPGSVLHSDNDLRC